jgi:predicted nucleic acid-binding protein
VATSLADELPQGAQVAVDTNIFIYYVEANQEYLGAVVPLFRRIDEGSVVVHVSAITLTELLIKPIRENRTDLADQYREYLTDSENVVCHGLDQVLADKAGVLGGRYGLRTPDAIICATALRANCAYMITNDDKFDRVPGIRTLKVSDYV